MVFVTEFVHWVGKWCCRIRWSLRVQIKKIPDEYVDVLSSIKLIDPSNLDFVDTREHTSTLRRWVYVTASFRFCCNVLFTVWRAYTCQSQDTGLFCRLENVVERGCCCDVIMSWRGPTSEFRSKNGVKIGIGHVFYMSLDDETTFQCMKMMVNWFTMLSCSAGHNLMVSLVVIYHYVKPVIGCTPRELHLMMIVLLRIWITEVINRIQIVYIDALFEIPQDGTDRLRLVLVIFWKDSLYFLDEHEIYEIDICIIAELISTFLYMHNMDDISFFSEWDASDMNSTTSMRTYCFISFTI